MARKTADSSRAPWTPDVVYDAAQEFVEQALRRDGSLFEPGKQIWTAENLERLIERVGAEDTSNRSFGEKLREQLDGVSPDARQLAGEVLFVQLLSEDDTTAEKKREHIANVLGVAPADLDLPSSLDDALAGGVARYANSRNLRDAFLRYLIRFGLSWKRLDETDRSNTLADPWKFRDFANGIDEQRGGMQREALIHLVFPDEFEPVLAPDAKRRIAKAFGTFPGFDASVNTDRQLREIRVEIAKILGPDFAFYRLPRRVWDEPEMPQWREFVSWATRLYNEPDFDDHERDYKLSIARSVSELLNAAEQGGDIVAALRNAFRAPENNLLNWRVMQAFTNWANARPDETRTVLLQIREQETAAPIGAVPAEAVGGAGVRTSLASFFLMGVDATRFPIFRPAAFTRFCKLVGADAHGILAVEIDADQTYRPEELAAAIGVGGRDVRDFLRATYPRQREAHQAWHLSPDQAAAVLQHFASRDGAPAEQVYTSFLALLDELRLRLLAHGVRLRDRLDAQGLMWWIVSDAASPPDHWSEQDKSRFLAFRSGATTNEAGPPPPPPPPHSGADVPNATGELSEKLLVPTAWLQEIVDLLNEKRQVIFYGPPGTGKTFVAQAFAEHVARAGGITRLVQFHPAYSYEDFFEGYRPTRSENGALAFDLRAGPLRDIAAAAETTPDAPHLLIIDEINRGNIAKIFGELYFLLEYRNSSIRLQYRPDDDFLLPANLYVIGTMNTADRSIALVDSALRRRFYFQPFLPTIPPIRSVLREWLSKEGYPDEAAVLLDSLNDELREANAGDEFAIGPSYFMTSKGAPNVDRVWRYAILPLLEERFYGALDRSDIEQRFGLSTLRRRMLENQAIVEDSRDDAA